MSTRTTSKATERSSKTTERPGKPTERPGKSTDRSGKTGNFGRFQNLVRDTYSEIKKVSWPDQETTRNLTVLVIAMATVLGILLGLVDYAFRELWNWIPA